jgi:transcriptional regulator with XRE-family HTH domain
MAKRYRRGAPTLLTQLVGLSVRHRRLERNIGMRALAAHVGVTPGVLSELECKPRAHVTIANLERYAGALGVPVSEIVRDAEALRCEIHEPWERPAKHARSDDELRIGRALGRVRRLRRKESGHTLTTFAEASSIDVSRVCEHERGVTLPCLTTLAKYARAHGCMMSDLLRDAESELQRSEV